MPAKDKRKLAAITFADVVGYSRMMASNEERTLELLKDFENICSPIISKHDGEIIKKVGDELFCEFSSAKQAVDSALEIQEAIQPYNDSRPKDFKLQVRIGIHVGDIVLRDGDVFGDGVNVASRIQPFANPGGICVSNTVRDALSSHPNYDIESEGKQELKNIIEKHTLYSIKTGFEDKTTIRKYRKSKKSIPVLIGILATCFIGMLFFGDSLNIGEIDSNIAKQNKEKIDSYYIRFTSNPIYIDDLYHQYSDFDIHFSKDEYSIHSIDDSLLETLKKQCFNSLNGKFQNKGIDILCNFNPSHIITLDSLNYPANYKGKVPYPVNELSQLLNVENKNIPKVFIDILIYNRKDLRSGEEKIFIAYWSRIRQDRNLSSRNAQYFDNDKDGQNKLIDALKGHLIYNIDLISFSKNPFHKWIGEIKEILPNDMMSIKLYSPNSIKSNLELKGQKRIRYTKESIKEHISDIQSGIDFIEQNKQEVSDSIYQKIFELEKDLDQYGELLDSLINNKIHKPGINWNHNLNYKLEVISVMDTIALCKLLEKEKPWATVRVGHKLIISE